jgi:hypothetical protein
VREIRRKVHIPGVLALISRVIELFCTLAMLNLTKQQQMVICVVALLLLTGWAVKAWRMAHPSVSAQKLQRP